MFKTWCSISHVYNIYIYIHTVFIPHISMYIRYIYIVCIFRLFEISLDEHANTYSTYVCIYIYMSMCIYIYVYMRVYIKIVDILQCRCIYTIYTIYVLYIFPPCTPRRHRRSSSWPQANPAAPRRVSPAPPRRWSPGNKCENYPLVN